MGHILFVLECGGEYPLDSGVIYSPGYPAVYDNYLDCTYTIQHRHDLPLRMDIMHMDIEWENDCAYDYLKVNV